jgi:hypothetical protein
MPSPEIEEFAKILVQQIRDRAIQENDITLRPDCEALRARRWRQSGASLESIAMAVPDIVDTALFHLLYAIDEGLLRIKFVSHSGREIDLTEEGGSELAGWYMGTDGWVCQYAKERYVDDVAQLATWPPPRLAGDAIDDDDDGDS